MLHGLITHKDAVLRSDERALLRSGLIHRLENSETHKLWIAMLKDLGLDYGEHGYSVKDLFCVVKAAFESEYSVSLDVSFEEGFIAAEGFQSSVEHNREPRVYSLPTVVYLDELMVSVFFEYIAVYYIWSRYGSDVEGKCFKLALYALDHCCRKGNLNSDEGKSELMKLMREYCDDVAVQFIEDAYWNVLAFAIGHEIAHIYIRERGIGSSDPWELEYQADAIGYGIILNLIEGKYPDIQSPFRAAFHDYLYTTPMVTFLFYGDLAYMSYWLFGEKADGGHPHFEDRINRMIKVSEAEKYTFDTKLGNDVLNSFWDISDRFREELFYKLKNGKLVQIIGEGANTTMNGNGYEEANRCYNQMSEEMRELAVQWGVDPDKLIGLWDIVVQIDVVGKPGAGTLVWKDRDEVYSTKPYNVFFRLKDLLLTSVEIGVTVGPSDGPTQTILKGLYILCKLLEVSTVKLNEDQAKLLAVCHKQSAYDQGIDEDELLDSLGISSKTVDELVQLHCIRLEEGKIYLPERILIKDD